MSGEKHGGFGGATAFEASETHTTRKGPLSELAGRAGDVSGIELAAQGRAAQGARAEVVGEGHQSATREGWLPWRQAIDRGLALAQLEGEQLIGALAGDRRVCQPDRLAVLVERRADADGRDFCGAKVRARAAVWHLVVIALEVLDELQSLSGKVHGWIGGFRADRDANQNPNTASIVKPTMPVQIALLSAMASSMACPPKNARSVA